MTTEQEIEEAIDALDGNMPIERLGESEFHKKLKEHLEYFDYLEAVHYGIRELLGVE